MPTTVTKTIKSSGGDYGSLAAWEAAENGNLVAADEIRVASCYDLGALDGIVTLAGGTTDSTRYLKIQGVNNTGGVWNTANYRIGQTTFGTIISNQQDSTRFYDLQIQTGVTGAYGGRGIEHVSAGTSARVERCIFAGTGTSYNSTGGTDSYGIYESLGGHVGINNIFYGFRSSLGSCGVIAGGYGSSYYYNNTFYNCDKGLLGNGGGGGSNVWSRNNVAQGCPSYCYANIDTGSGNSVTNISDDGSHGVGKTATVLFVSTTLGSEDLHLSTSDTQAVGYGTDLTANGITVDIDGVARYTPWDAGADQHLASVGDAYLLEYPRIGLEDDSGAILTEAADAILNEAAPLATDHIRLEDGSGNLLLEVIDYFASADVAISSWVTNAPTYTVGGLTSTPSSAIANWTTNNPSNATALSVTSTASVSNWITNTPVATLGGISSTPISSVATWNNTNLTVLGALSVTTNAATSSWVNTSPTYEIGLTTTASVSNWITNTPSITLVLSITSAVATSTWVTNTPSVTNALSVTAGFSVSNWITNTPSFTLGGLSLATTVTISTWNNPTPTATLALSVTTNTATSSWVNNNPTVSSNSTQTTTASVSSWVNNNPTTVLALSITIAAAQSSWVNNNPSTIVGGLTQTPSSATSSWNNLTPSSTNTLSLATSSAISTWVANDATLLFGNSFIPEIAISSWVANSPTYNISVTASPAVVTWHANDATATATGIVGALYGQLFPRGYN